MTWLSDGDFPVINAAMLEAYQTVALQETSSFSILIRMELLLADPSKQYEDAPSRVISLFLTDRQAQSIIEDLQKHRSP